MAIPNRSEQARKLASWLEAGAEDGEDIDAFSRRIVDAFHEMLTSGLKSPRMRLETGTAFKSPFSSKVYWVAWQDETNYWVTQDGDSYGWMALKGDEFFEYATPSSAKAGKPGTNKNGWREGDVVSSFQGSMKYVIAAVSGNGVLLYQKGCYMPESNENMSKYYTKESK